MVLWRRMPVLYDNPKGYLAPPADNQRGSTHGEGGEQAYLGTIAQALEATFLAPLALEACLATRVATLRNIAPFVRREGGKLESLLTP